MQIESQNPKSFSEQRHEVLDGNYEGISETPKLVLSANIFNDVITRVFDKIASALQPPMVRKIFVGLKTIYNHYNLKYSVVLSYF